MLMPGAPGTQSRRSNVLQYRIHPLFWYLASGKQTMNSDKWGLCRNHGPVDWFSSSDFWLQYKLALFSVTNGIPSVNRLVTTMPSPHKSLSPECVRSVCRYVCVYDLPPPSTSVNAFGGRKYEMGEEEEGGEKREKNWWTVNRKGKF